MKIKFLETGSLKALQPHWRDGVELEVEADEGKYLLTTFPDNFIEVKLAKQPERTKEKRPNRNK